MNAAMRRILIRAAWFVGAAVLGGGCDLRSKHWAEETLSELPGRSMHLVEPWVELRLSYNQGTAFSLIQDLGTARMVFGVVSLLVVVALLVVALRTSGKWVPALALGTIAGGAIGNGVDRIFHSGVVDFISLNYPGGGSWPTFNVADALVVIGVAMLLIHQWVSREPGPPEPAGSS